MRLLRESETKEKEYFMSPISFLDAEVEVPKEFAYENVMVKGSNRTGKTSKVLIPLYKEFEYGKLYITLSNNYAERIVEEDTVVIDMRKQDIPMTAMEVVSSLIKGEEVYLNVDVTCCKEQSTKMVNDIFRSLLDRKEELVAPVLIAFDDISYTVRVENLLEYLESSSEGREKDKNKNFYLASTLCYTRQLIGLYKEEEVEEIRKYVTMVDVEKQPLVYN